MNMPEERLSLLMMKAVDELLSAEEAAELEMQLRARPELQEELQDFKLIKRSTDALTQRILADALEPARPREERLGFALIGGGGLMIGGFALYALAISAAPLALKLGGLGVILGLGLLGGRILWRRLSTYQHDPYKEIDQ